MKVAIGVSRLDFVPVDEGETRFRLGAGLERMTLDALARMKRDPFDVMFREGRVNRFPDLNRYDVPFALDDGNVLFERRVDRPRFEFRHRASAADERNPRVFDFHGDISAVGTIEITFLP